jgi:hypothetical protein
MIKKLCIFGTRTFYKNSKAAAIIDAEIDKLKPEMIITAGDADGICKLAIDKAKEHSIPVELHFLNGTKYAAGMYDHRSRDILARADHVLFIHDGVSKGTRNEINQAEKIGLSTTYYKINADDTDDMMTGFKAEDIGG